MAQTTAGIRLWFGDSTVTNGVAAIPSSWGEIPDIISTPALNAPPAKLDTTNLAQTTYKTYIQGLTDLGGSLEFSAHLTTELIAATDLAIATPATGKVRAWCVTFPAPLAKRYWWVGELVPVAPNDAAVDAVAETKLYISQETEVICVAGS